MKNIRWFVLAIIISLIGFAPPASGQQQQNQGSVLVGRIAYIEGQLLRYVPEEKDWVATVQDAPFGMDDSLYAGENTNAELIMPNNTWVRIGSNTQLQLIKLDTDVFEVDAASGVARFYNKSAQAVIKATTPFGYVIAPANSSFDLYVGNESVEVISLRGTVTFVHDAGNAKYEVTAGGSSLLADSKQVTAGQGAVIADWGIWNEARDNVWRNRLAEKGTSAKYLPAGLDDEAYALEENGRWDQVYYEGAYRNFWRPMNVYDGWAPYTVGRWTQWYGDPCWIPDEPFGYVTHHYGSWVYVDNCRCWYWVPPVAHVRGRTGPYIGYGWYPGRVSWIYTDGYVGWVPLSPWEPYYCHRRWGPHSVVIINGHVPHIDHHHHRHIDHAVIIRQNELYTVNNYRRVQVKNVHRDTILAHYKGMPVLNDSVIGHKKDNSDRYKFTSGRVSRKPQQNALDRITYNQERYRKAGRESSGTMLQHVGAIKKGRPEQGITLKQPEPVSKLAPAPVDAKRREPIRFDRRDIAEQEKTPQPAITLPAETGGERLQQPRHTQPAQISEPEKPGQPARPRAPRPEQPEHRAQPVRIGEPEKPVQAERPRAPHYPAGMGVSQPEHPERLRPQPPARVSPREEAAPTVRHTNPEPIRRLPQGTAVHEPGQKIGIDKPEPPQKYREERQVPRTAPPERIMRQEPRPSSEAPVRAEPRTAPQREQRMSTPQQPGPSQQMRYLPPSVPAQRSLPAHR